MLSIQEVSAEQLAKLFHHYQDALAHGCAGHNNEDGSSWDRTPPNERKVMIAAARLTLLELSTAPAQRAQAANTMPSRARRSGDADVRYSTRSEIMGWRVRWRVRRA